MRWPFNLFGRAGQEQLPQPALTPAQRQALDTWKKKPAADLDRSHYCTRYVVVDVEASGLDMKKDRLISIGALAVNGGIIDFSDAFQVVLRQDEVSTHDNILIHGIGGAAQRAGTDPADALLAFLDYAGKSPLVAYHALFDQTMIDGALQTFLGLAMPSSWIDLAWVMPDLFRQRINAQVVLDEWLTLFGIDNFARHNAVADAFATAQLLQVALARSQEKDADSPASLLRIEKARRWMYQDH